MDQPLPTCWSQVSTGVQWEGSTGAALPWEDSGLLQKWPGVGTALTHVGRTIEKPGGKRLSKPPMLIPLYINNSSLTVMRLESSAFPCSCHEAEPRWTSLDTFQRAWETGKRKQRSLPREEQNGLFIKLQLHKTPASNGSQSGQLTLSGVTELPL